MSDMPQDITGKVTSDLDIFKKIASYIPGFKGYIERQSRRDQDKLLRDVIAERIEQQYGRVSALQRQFVSEGQITLVDDMEAAAIKLRTFADRIRRATRGYSGLFDAVKINEPELAKIYGYDASLLEKTDEITHAVDNIEESVGTDGLPAAIRHLSSVSQEAIDLFNRRDEIVLSPAQ